MHISKTLGFMTIMLNVLMISACQTHQPLSTNTQSSPSNGIIFYNGPTFTGSAFALYEKVEDFSTLSAIPNYGHINDSAQSVKAFGRWQVCQNTNFTGECRIIEGDVVNLGSLNQSISSARYMGQGRQPSNITLTNSTRFPNPLNQQINRQKNNIENRTTNEVNSHIDNAVNRVLNGIFSK